MPFKKMSLSFLLIALAFSALSFTDPHWSLVTNAAVDTKEEKKSICLAMIVKNESRIIERCLDSAKGLVDCISICDTGSTDNTVEIIEKYMKDNNIPGEVHRHQWKNFGHNRTLSCQAAQETLVKLGFPLSNTYMLLLDADMLLEVSPSFSKETLNCGSYMIVQRTSDLSYFNTRLIQASMPWECVGVTHEYWSCKFPCQRSSLMTLSIDDHNDGGCKADKFERDISLLTQGLKDEPDNGRYMFYLAQSYKCIGQYEDAIKWYKERIGKGGWKEEVWYSKFMIGECFESLKYWDMALFWYLDAFQYDYERAESLLKIARYYRINGQNSLAYMYAKQGKLVPYPKEHMLFVSHPVYEYQFDEELSIAAFYTPYHEEGYEAANKLVLKKGVPYFVKDQAYRNMTYYDRKYDKKLKNIKYQSINIDLPLIREGFSHRYKPMNPSICRTADGYDVICRTVNYIHRAGNYIVMDEGDSHKTVRTKNFLVQYDSDLNIISQKEIIEDLPRVHIFSRNIEGLEDCRLTKLNDDTWFLCSTYDTSPFREVQISLCKLGQESSENSINVDRLIPLQGPDPKRCEKNWLPFVKDNELHVIYSYDPFIIKKIDIDTGATEDVLRYEPSHNFTHFRGSAAPIEFDGGYLTLVHEVAFMNDNQRNYFHRFVYMDKDFVITKLSKPFTFMHTGVEYCVGMTIDHSGENLVIPIGIEDGEAYIGTIDLNSVRSILEPLPE